MSVRQLIAIGVMVLGVVILVATGIDLKVLVGVGFILTAVGLLT